MANHRLNLENVRFGKLVGVALSHRDEKGHWWWTFKCDCGGTVTRAGHDLIRASKKGAISHCGCSPALKTHGLAMPNRKLNQVWAAMRQRCGNPSNKDYPNYGGRGIRICDEWGDFSVFYTWAIAAGYVEGVTIERVDVNRGYEPDNCTWVPNERQALNTRRIRMFEWCGQTYRIRELAILAGISHHTMKTRLVSLGWSVERAMSTEVKS